MSLYQKKLVEMIKNNFAECSTEQVVDAMARMGILENSTIKVLLIREFVHKSVNEGQSKLESMWMASVEFACSYEYVRKCIYYYKDVNLVSKDV